MFIEHLESYGTKLMLRGSIVLMLCMGSIKEGRSSMIRISCEFSQFFAFYITLATDSRHA